MRENIAQCMDNPFEVRAHFTHQNYHFSLGAAHRDNGDGTGHSLRIGIHITNRDGNTYYVSFTPKQLLKMVKEMSQDLEYEGLFCHKHQVIRHGVRGKKN